MSLYAYMNTNTVNFGEKLFVWDKLLSSGDAHPPEQEDTHLVVASPHPLVSGRTGGQPP